MPLRAILRKALHTSVLWTGFRLVRVLPFERSLRRWELEHEDFFMVQVGAHNGVTSDPFQRFIAEGVWSCTLVEPQASSCQILRTIYEDRDRVRTVHAAIGRENGTMTLYKVREGASDVPHWASQLASTRREVIASHADRIPNLEAMIVEEHVPCITLQNVLNESGFPRLDLLAVDVEGYDFEIVKQIDTLPFHPQFIYYEHLHLSDAEQQTCLAFLAERGYACHAVNNGDTFAEQHLQS